VNVEEVAPGLWHWTAPHPEWKPEYDQAGQGWGEIVSSYALVGEHGIVLIDPQLPPEGADRDRFWAALDRDVEAHGRPQIVITVYWHARSADEIAARYRNPAVWAPSDTPDGHIAYTQTYRAGDELPARIRTFDVPRLGEVFFYLPSHRAALFGDVVLDGVRLLPESWLRNDVTHTDVADALRPLLDEELELLLLTHGGPVTDAARDKLRDALEV
jgi:hypothetical protein